MRCAQAREALSAWYDGERCTVDPSAVAAHVAGCAGCTAFQRALGAIADLADVRAATPDPPFAVPAPKPPVTITQPGLLARPHVRLALRFAVGLAAVGSLVPALAEIVGTDHEAHESFAFTVAVVVALLAVALRPGLATAYLPVVGVASVLVTVTSAVDVDEGHVGLAHELRHLGVLLGCVLVALLVAGDRPGRRLATRRPRPARAPRAPAVRLLGRHAVPALSGTILAVLVLLVGPRASAHAMLEGSTPAADAVLQRAPSSVTLVFNESVSLLPDSVRVFGPDGGRVDEGTVERAHGDGATAEVGLRGGLGDGSYLVSYRVISADSHPVEGAYTFVVGHPSRTPVPSAAATSDGGSRSVGVLLGVSRWLTYAGSALGLGGFAFLVWCWPAGWDSRRARVLVNAGVGVLWAGTLMAMLLKGPYDAGLDLGHVTDWALLREVLGTTYGRALDVRFFMVAGLLLLLTYREHIPRRVLGVLPAVLLLATGVTFALGGHAAAGSHRGLALASDTLHLAAMSLWLGGLTVLLAAVLVRDRRTDELNPVLRFSTLATGAVTVLIATGVFQTLREVKSWDILFHTHYGHVLVVKLAIVGVALLAAAGSRTWVWQTVNPVVPVHAATAAPAEPVVADGPSLRRLRTSVGVEASMLVGVLVATAMLVTSDPAVSAPQPHPVSANLVVGPDRVQVSAAPSGSRRVQIMLQVTDASGKPTEPREIDATLTLSSSKVGPLPVKLARMGPGDRMGVVSVPLAGDWKLAVTVRTSAIDEATAYADIPID